MGVWMDRQEAVSLEPLSIQLADLKCAFSCYQHSCGSGDRYDRRRSRSTWQWHSSDESHRVCFSVRERYQHCFRLW